MGQPERCSSPSDKPRLIWKIGRFFGVLYHCKLCNAPFGDPEKPAPGHANVKPWFPAWRTLIVGHYAVNHSEVGFTRLNELVTAKYY